MNPTPPLTVKDVQPDTPAPVTLADIVTRSVELPLNANADTPIRVRPINLKGMANIEREFGSFDAIDAHLASTATPTLSTLKLITILVNQDRAEHEELSFEAVGRMIDGTRLPLIRSVLEAMTRPLRVAAPAAAKAPEASPSEATGGG